MTNVSLSGSTLTLSGEVFDSTSTVAFAGRAISQTPITIQIQSAPTNTGNSSLLDINSATASSVIVNTQLLAYLAISRSGPGSPRSIAALGTGSGFSYTVDGDTFTARESATSTTLESVSFVICGGAALEAPEAGGRHGVTN